MKPEKLTQKYLKEILSYDPETGIFTWRVCKADRLKPGDLAGCYHKSSGYWVIVIDGRNYQAHRLAFLWMEGFMPENHIDHIDRDRANNKWINLREASRSCNSRNSKVRTTNTSGVTGVYNYKGSNKWIARIFSPKKIHLGCFDNLIDAAKARWEAEVKYGYPNCNSNSSAYLYLKEHQAI